MENEATKKSKTGLIIGVIAVVIVLAAAAAFLLLNRGISPEGAWHSEETKQMLRFHEDGTVVIHTQNGDDEASYVFDKESGKGQISLNGISIEFTVSKDELVLKSGGVENVFERGELDAGEAGATTAGPVTTTPAAQSQETTTEKTGGEETATTAKPEGTEKESASVNTTLPTVTTTEKESASQQVTFAPGDLVVVKPGDILIGLVGNPIKGKWQNSVLKSISIIFGDTTYTAFNGVKQTGAGDYEYDKMTGLGYIDYNGTKKTFKVVQDTLSWDDGFEVDFIRQ